MDYLRAMVSGKSKKRFINSDYNLDLTYVCPRIIAMSFPAEGLESSYRNKLVDVDHGLIGALMGFLLCFSAPVLC